jgi:hypothetical protein
VIINPKCIACDKDTITVSDNITSEITGAVIVRKFKTKCNKPTCNEGNRFFGVGKTKKISMSDYSEKYDKNLDEIIAASRWRSTYY